MRFPPAILVGMWLVFPTASDAQPSLSADEMRRFLLTAEVADWEPIGVGVTGSWRVTLSDGTLTHDAAFQSVDEASPAADPLAPSPDSYRYNIAAYRLAELIGLVDMMPVTVGRTVRDIPGALTWWVDDVLYDEETRRQDRAWPSDLEHWGWQIDRMWIFAELVRDTDRHERNILYTEDWTLYMIDFTRAFGVGQELMRPFRLRQIDGPLLSRLEALTEAEVSAAVAPYLNDDQVAGVLHRRDRLVAHFRSLP